MEPIKKQLEDMIAAQPGQNLDPDKITELAANFERILSKPAQASGKADQEPA